MLACTNVSPGRLQLHEMHRSRSYDIAKFKELLGATQIQASSELQQMPRGDLRLGPQSKAVRSSFNLLFGTVLLASSSGKEQARKARFSPAAWLSWSWGFELVASTMFGKPHFLYRTFNIVPRDSPIRIACARGDQKEVERLFSEGLATPYDVTNEGSTLLHVSKTFLPEDQAKRTADAKEITTLTLPGRRCGKIFKALAYSNFLTIAIPLAWLFTC